MNLLYKKTPFFESLPTIKINKDDLSIIENTARYKDKILELIVSAKQRIYITTLYLQDDEAGQEILTAIYDAKQDNPDLDVKIFVDFLRAQRGLMGFAKSEGNVRLYKEMNSKYEHTIEIYGVPVKSKEFLGVLHLKGFVFDEAVLYSGSSINNIYLQQFERYRYDRYHLIQSKQLADTLVQFLRLNFVNNAAVKSLTKGGVASIKTLKNAIRHMKLSLRKADYFVKEATSKKTDSDILISPLLGFGLRRNNLNKTIVELVRGTQKSVVIFTPYFNFPPKVNRSVRKLLKQGKKITIIVGDKTANDFYIPEDEPFNKAGILPYIYEASLKRFIRANQKFVDQGFLDVCLWLDKGNSFHLKGISSDQQNHLITGHNINPRAWRLDIENGILIQDQSQQLKEKFDSELSQVMKHCTRISHFDDIETPDDYRPEAKKLLKRVKRAKLDSILNRLL
ncbi:MAG: CDP-diacylglycerol--serine O-phosphatidyltransferase [Kangiellaceae bacterium]|nr:CDP-diacylglycerol--serine O-phosphatidyltransferase [Kangiellaceae bacterium]